MILLHLRTYQLLDTVFFRGPCWGSGGKALPVRLAVIVIPLLGLSNRPSAGDLLVVRRVFNGEIDADSALVGVYAAYLRIGFERLLIDDEGTVVCREEVYPSPGVVAVFAGDDALVAGVILSRVNPAGQFLDP